MCRWEMGQNVDFLLTSVTLFNSSNYTYCTVFVFFCFFNKHAFDFTSWRFFVRKLIKKHFMCSNNDCPSQKVLLHVRMALGRECVSLWLDAAVCDVLTPSSPHSGQASLVVRVTDGSLASIDWKRREKRGSLGGVCRGREGMIVCPTLHKTQVTPH